MKFVVIGYWLWFGVSVLLLARRAVMRRSGRAERRRGPDASSADTQISEVASRVVARAAQLAGTSPPPTSIGPSVVAPTAQTPVSETGPGPSSALAGTVFAPLPRAVRSSAAGTRTTLGEALRGIAMPSDLAPLVHIAGGDPNRRAVFATTGRALERVGAEVAEELQRLGFALEPMGPQDAIARRGEDSLAVRLRAIGPQPKTGPADAAYPTAPECSVVLDVELT